MGYFKDSDTHFRPAGAMSQWKAWQADNTREKTADDTGRDLWLTAGAQNKESKE